ncbi:MAG: hypothetical protein IIC11_11435 [Proteobacteria bacterium]|nr:hypothetical protein [Pseudomonadota bacterium]
MNPTEARSHRLTELSNLVKFLDNKGTTSEEIIKAVRERAHQMAAHGTAEGYVDEIIRRFTK